MSRRMVSVRAVILAVVCAAAAFVWLHAGGQKTVVQFTSRSSGLEFEYRA